MWLAVEVRVDGNTGDLQGYFFDCASETAPEHTKDTIAQKERVRIDMELSF